MSDTNDNTPGDGLIVADRVLDEPHGKGWLTRRVRPVPHDLFPKPDEVLVLRGEVDFIQLGWGQVPDPSDPQWLDARAATLVRRQWREEVVLYVPSSSPDRHFTVVAPLNSKVTSPVTFLTHADPTSSDVYRDAIGTMARNLGKQYDARHSDEFESELRARLKAWVRMKRSLISGVTVELGLIEVRPPEKAIKDVESSTDAVWDEERQQLQHRNRLAGWNRHDEEHTQRDAYERHRLESRKHLELLEDEFDGKRRLAGLEAEQERERVALAGQSLYELKALEEEQKREPLHQELELDRDAFESDRRFAALEARKAEELRALETENRNDLLRRQLEQARREAERSALADDAETYEELLAGPHGTAALGMARAELSAEKVFDTQVTDDRRLEDKLVALIGVLLKSEGDDDSDLGEAGRQLVMAEIRRLHGLLQTPPGRVLPGASSMAQDLSLESGHLGTEADGRSDPTDIAEDDLDADVEGEGVIDVHPEDRDGDDGHEATSGGASQVSQR